MGKRTEDLKNPFESVKNNIVTAAGKMKIDKETVSVLLNPQKEIKVSFPVKMDNGKVKYFIGYRVQHSNARGVMKGGLRIRENININNMTALASINTWKTSIMDLPFGGAMGGISCNINAFSDHEKERIIRGYIRSIKDHIGPQKDMPCPDMATDEKIMGWIMDEYSTLTGYTCPEIVSGKPIDMYSQLSRQDYIAMTAIFAAIEAIKTVDFLGNKDVLTYAVEGFGSIGQKVALLAKEMFKEEFGIECRLVGISDSQGAVYSPKGINPEDAIKHKKNRGKIKGLKKTRPTTTPKLLELDVDIIFTAAIEHTITKDNANKVNPRILCEVSNSPVEASANRILYKNGVFIVPDIIAGSGGLILSHLEHISTTTGKSFTTEEIKERLQNKIKQTFYDVLKTSKKRKTDMRTAAYMMAIEKELKAMKIRGWI